MHHTAVDVEVGLQGAVIRGGILLLCRRQRRLPSLHSRNEPPPASNFPFRGPVEPLQLPPIAPSVRPMSPIKVQRTYSQAPVKEA